MALLIDVLIKNNFNSSLIVAIVVVEYEDCLQYIMAFIL